MFLHLRHEISYFNSWSCP